jgi:hypothetical protein
VWALILLYVCYRKWGKIIDYLRWKTGKLKKQEEYDNFHEGPANLSARNDQSFEAEMAKQ